MTVRITLTAALLLTQVALGYIHFPPMTLPKMCKHSTLIRVLSVKKFDREKGVVIFEVAETLKGKNPSIKSFKHALRPEVKGVKPVLDWLGDDKRAVMFTIEAPGGLACGYVFIDDYCYSVDYNRPGAYWMLLRAEPDLLACYHGSAKRLHELAKDILAGKEVKVPVKEPKSPVTEKEKEKRRTEVTDGLNKNRGGP
jgi:hypothetical protein